MPIATTVPIAVTSPLPFAVDKKVEAGATKEARVESGAALTLPGAGHGLNLLRVSTIETPIAEFVARCLEKKPWNRYDTATIARSWRPRRGRGGGPRTREAGELGAAAESATRESARPDPNMRASAGPSGRPEGRVATARSGPGRAGRADRAHGLAPTRGREKRVGLSRRAFWWLADGLALGRPRSLRFDTIAAVDVERAARIGGEDRAREAKASAEAQALRERKAEADMRLVARAWLAKDEADATAWKRRCGGQGRGRREGAGGSEGAGRGADDARGRRPLRW
jgi:hypothetical protein